MTFAVIGDSFIARLSDYVQSEQHPAKRYAFFGVSGMSTNRKFEAAFQCLKEMKPSYVIINIGGNDLRCHSDARSVFSDIVECTDRIHRECENIKGIWVFSIIERGKFPFWTGLNRTLFNRLRREVNKLLKEHYGKAFVDVQKSIRYPKHYENDLVHPKKGVGLKLLGDIVMRCFKSFH